MTKQFYLTSRHGNCGGTTMFYNKNGKGYGTALDNAELFTLEKAMEHHDRDIEAMPLLKTAVDAVSKLHVDCQNLSRFNASEFDSSDEYIMQVDRHWCGNDILFITNDVRSYDYAQACVITKKEACDFILKNSVEASANPSNEYYFKAWPKEFLDSVARRTLEVADINKRAMCSSAGVKLHRPKRQRPTTGKTRKNCEGCGRIVWEYDPYSEVTCHDH